jgi:CheY-like chemotaxis protein
VVIAVSDTGHGMDRETLTHLFEPFFTTKGLGKGTGLGLSTVYGIVRQSDGYIWVYSEPSQGTTFKIYLPVTAGEMARLQTPSLLPQAGAGECILVVEDEVGVRYMMKRALEGTGYHVLEAGSTAEALNIILNTRQISLVLADVIMPGQSGRELADQIAKLRPGIPVLFTSGYTDSEIERRGLLEPGAAFLQKPVTPNALIGAVRRQLEAARHPAGSEPADGY